jgi:hypothetical protein
VSALRRRLSRRSASDCLMPKGSRSAAC